MAGAVWERLTLFKSKRDKDQKGSAGEGRKQKSSSNSQEKKKRKSVIKAGDKQKSGEHLLKKIGGGGMKRRGANKCCDLQVLQSHGTNNTKGLALIRGGRRGGRGNLSERKIFAIVKLEPNGEKDSACSIISEREGHQTTRDSNEKNVGKSQKKNTGLFTSNKGENDEYAKDGTGKRASDKRTTAKEIKNHKRFKRLPFVTSKPRR